MSNHHLKNKALSLKAKGLLSLMLSLPDDWSYTLKGLTVISLEGIDAIRQAIAELEKHRYVVRSRVRDEKGCLRGSEYAVYEQPLAQDRDCVNDQGDFGEPALEKSILDDPMLEIPVQGSSALEIPTQLNTNERSTNLTQINSLSSPSVLRGKETTDRRGKTDIDDEAITTSEMLIKANIGYEDFQESRPCDMGLVDEIVAIMVDVLVTPGAYVSLEGENKPRKLIARRLMKLGHWHIEHVLGQFKAITTPIKKKRQYFLTMLYNASLEFEAHYTNAVNSDWSGIG